MLSLPCSLDQNTSNSEYKIFKIILRIPIVSFYQVLTKTCNILGKLEQEITIWFWFKRLDWLAAKHFSDTYLFK